jgi:hypothetical protein
MDRNIAIEYLQDNFEADDRLAVVLLNKQTGHVLQRIATAAKIAEPRYQAWLRHMNVSRYEVYVSMNTLKPDAHGRTKSDIHAIRHVYLDLDDGGQAKLDALLARTDVPHPNWVMQSSPGKFQVVWKVEGFDMRSAEALMRDLAASTGADPAATDAARVLRLPGFRNHKYGSPGHVVEVRQLAEQRSSVHAFPGAAEHPSREPAPSRATRTGSSGLSQSERDWAYAKRALRRGDPPESVIRRIAESRRKDKSNPEYYARHTVLKAANDLAARSR